MAFSACFKFSFLLFCFPRGVAPQLGKKLYCNQFVYTQIQLLVDPTKDLESSTCIKSLDIIYVTPKSIMSITTSRINGARAPVRRCNQPLLKSKVVMQIFMSWIYSSQKLSKKKMFESWNTYKIIFPPYPLINILMRDAWYVTGIWKKCGTCTKFETLILSACSTLSLNSSYVPHVTHQNIYQLFHTFLVLSEIL